uniref:Peptidase aspartic putative domain-containing protein n=1 Tax=Bracon brevicornis TaxID=1563983 RepID=A0A6V7JGQ3_9HYME
MHLADQSLLISSPIDIIIGADSYGEIIKKGFEKFTSNQLVAQETIFGWVITGPVNCQACTTRTSTSLVSKSTTQQLLDLMKNFWLQEEIPNQSNAELSAEERECELRFQQTFERDPSGRYVMRLPFKTSVESLGDSKSKAIRAAYQMKARLPKSPEVNQQYQEFLKEYEELNHMKRAPRTPETVSAFHLPHHAAIKEASITAKLRVIFNASAKSSTGVSLNDILHQGQKLQNNCGDVLLWFRRHQWVFGTDITKMFREINVHPANWSYQRIMWFDETEQLTPYQLTTVTCGTTCAPWLALRTIQQLLIDEGNNYPKAVPALREGRYVDDIHGDSDDEGDLLEIIQQPIELCKSGGFPLQKWCSNAPHLLQIINLASASITSSALFDEMSTKVLGIIWSPSTDSFKYKLKPFTNESITKNVILSEIAQIYDPLGFVTPIIIKAKILIQELWSGKINWGDQLKSEQIIHFSFQRKSRRHQQSIYPTMAPFINA